MTPRMQPTNRDRKISLRLERLEALVKRLPSAPIRNALISGPVTIGAGGAVTASSVTGGTTSLSAEGAVTTAEDGSSTRLADGVAEVQSAPGEPWLPLEQVILDQVPAASDGEPPTSAPTVECIPFIGTVYLKVTPPANPDPIVGYKVYVNGELARIDTARLIPVMVDADGIDLPYVVDSTFEVSAFDADGDGPLSAAVDARPRKIVTEDIGDNVVTAALLAADVATIADLTAGFVMTGRVQVGASYWTPGEGLVIPQPDGGEIRLPADGVTPASITARLIAKSLTVEGNLNIQGANNKVSGAVVLSNGVTRPTAPPSISQTHPFATSVREGISGTPFWYGLTQHLTDTNTLVSANAFFGAGISLNHKTTNASILGPPSSDLPWTPGFNPTGGITTLTGSYYVLGYDTNRSNDWFIYRLNSSFQKVGELAIGTYGAVLGRPAIGNDGSNLMIALTKADRVTVNRVRADLTAGALLGGKPTSQDLMMPNLFSTPVSFIGESTYDYGAARIVCAIEGNAVYSFQATGAQPARVPEEVWGAASGGSVRGLVYIDSVFKSVDAAGRLATYSKIRVNSTVSGSYTWYDGVGTVRETQASDPAVFALQARAWPRIDAPPPPDNGVNDGNADRANRIGIYASVVAAGGTQPSRRLQAYLPVDPTTFIASRQLTADSISAGGTLEPTTNGFIGSTAGSAGTITAATGGTTVNGDSTGRIGPAVFTPTTMTIPDPLMPTDAANKRYVDGIKSTMWTVATLGSSWVSFDGGTTFDIPAYGITGGEVFCKGAMKDGTTGGTAFTLPAGMRPLKRRLFLCIANAGWADVRVEPTGAVYVNGYATGAGPAIVSLDNIRFPAEQ